MERVCTANGQGQTTKKTTGIQVQEDVKTSGDPYSIERINRTGKG